MYLVSTLERVRTSRPRATTRKISPAKPWTAGGDLESYFQDVSRGWLRGAKLEGHPAPRSANLLSLEKSSTVHIVAMDITSNLCASRNVDGFWRCSIAAN